MESLTTNGSAILPSNNSSKEDLATSGSGDKNPLSPVFWQTEFQNESDASVERRQAHSQIQLEDHTEETSEHFKALWAKSVAIDDYVIVSGTVGKLGAYVVWNCTVEILDGGSIKIRKRYSEFDKLRSNLDQTFPLAGKALPEIPPKSVFHKFQPKFLEKRKIGLQHFLNCVLCNPEFSGSPVVKEFVFP